MAVHRNSPKQLELPERVHITPSKHNPWRAAKAPGARFTYRQLGVMQRMGMDPEQVEQIGGVVRVYSPVTIREMWWPTTDATPVYVFDCPILEIRPNGFRLVIAPAGDRKIVHESGRLKRGQ